MDINYVDFLQFQRYFTPPAELEQAFIYIIRKPIDFSIDFSYRLNPWLAIPDAVVAQYSFEIFIQIGLSTYSSYNIFVMDNTILVKKVFKKR